MNTKFMQLDIDCPDCGRTRALSVNALIDTGTIPQRKFRCCGKTFSVGVVIDIEICESVPEQQA